MATATDAALAAEAVVGIRSAADALDPHDPARVRVLVGLLDQAATLLARSPYARYATLLAFLAHELSPAPPFQSEYWQCDQPLYLAPPQPTVVPDLSGAFPVP